MRHILNIYNRDFESSQLQSQMRDLTLLQIDGLQVELWRLNAQREIDRGFPVRSIWYYVQIAMKDIERGKPFSIPGLLNSIVGGLEAIKPGEPMHDLVDCHG